MSARSTTSARSAVSFGDGDSCWSDNDDSLFSSPKDVKKPSLVNMKAAQNDNKQVDAKTADSGQNDKKVTNTAAAANKLTKAKSEEASDWGDVSTEHL